MVFSRRYLHASHGVTRPHEAIEAPGPRLAYAEGLARAVLCKAGWGAWKSSEIPGQKP